MLFDYVFVLFIFFLIYISTNKNKKVKKYYRTPKKNIKKYYQTPKKKKEEIYIKSQKSKKENKKLSNEQKGIYQEFNIVENLKDININNYKVLRNVYIKKDDNETTELDIVIIHTTGIFVIESKNYVGKIIGEENWYKWKYFLGNNKYEFFNPIKQNDSHIKYLKKYINSFLEKEIKFFSLIIFNKKADISNIKIDKNKTTFVTNDLNFKYLIKVLTDKEKEILSQKEVDTIYFYLLKNSNVSEKEKEKHIQNIKNKYKK